MEGDRLVRFGREVGILRFDVYFIDFLGGSNFWCIYY